MSEDGLDALRWQFDMVWSLAVRAHLPALTDAMCLWEPAPGAWTVRLVEGAWTPDWADQEPEPAPSPSIAWLAWHIAWWWSEALAGATAQPPPGRSGVSYPGSADGVRTQLEALARSWRAYLGGVRAEDLARPSTFPWTDERPLAMKIAWVNAELMKNIAEIGVVRRLYEARCGAGENHRRPTTTA